jgi:hypothetical protein
MSYRWPANRGGDDQEDDPGARGRFTARYRTEFDPAGARAATRPNPAARAARLPARAAPNGRQHLWQPLGPQDVLDGQPTGRSRITGRINALAVHDGGQRAYAASANGGVWYTRDGGAHWFSVGGFAPTALPGINRPAQRNNCGAIQVRFGATEADDEVFVGTGEPVRDAGPEAGGSLGGVGILFARNPANSALEDPWTREAPNLVGDGIYRIAREPGGNGVLAATRSGLWQRPAAPGAGVNWARPTGMPFDTFSRKVTDVLWTAANGGRPARQWVWVEDASNTGLWVRDVGAASPNFTPVALVAGATVLYTNRRASLAASNPATQIWVLHDQGDNVIPALFQVSSPVPPAAPQAVPVMAGLTNILRTQGFYDICLDVDPSNPNRVVLGGSFISTTTPDGQVIKGDGAIVIGDVALNGATLTFGFPTAAQMVGVGVHADIHDLKFSNNGASLWTGCDGGIYRSDHPGSMVGFYPRASGIAVVESNYIGCHPACEGNVAAGLQDNAAITRLSSGVWKLVGLGDGGGVVFEPLQPSRFLRQHFQGFWSSSDGTVPAEALLTRGTTFAKAEHDACAFYSTPAGIAHSRGSPAPAAPNVSQIIVGTTRVWYSENFGTSWVTLPTGSDPLPGNFTQDAFGEAVTVCRWQSPDVAWVLGNSRLRRYARTPGSDNGGGPGTWSQELIQLEPVAQTGKRKKQGPPPPVDGPMNHTAIWTDIAVNLDPPPAPGQPPAQRGAKGALYLGTAGDPADAGADTLWWFDGGTTWHKTHLRDDPQGVPAPVTSIVCDPAFPDEVFVGTTVGVWKGTRSFPAGQPPHWNWEHRVNGLPEAAVEDLAIFSHGGLRLLRAGIAARGVWELRLDKDTVQDMSYLRAHDDDLRHRDRAITVQRDGQTTRSWHGSPDVRPRIASSIAAAPGTLPWNYASAFVDAEPLRRLQAAVRSRSGDVRMRATGNWDPYFNELLRELGAPTMPAPAAPNIVALDSTFWTAQTGAPHGNAEPWGAGTPGEADLYDFAAPLTEGELLLASCTMPRRPCRVEVAVQHRGLNPRDGADVRVTLLQWLDPRTTGAADWADSTTWPYAGPASVTPGPTPVPWIAAVNDVLNNATGATTFVPTDGWSFVGTTDATRRVTLTGQTLDPLHAGVAGFDLDLSGVIDNAVLLLVAVIRAGADVNLPAGAVLEDLALGQSAVAVRSVRVHG